MPKPNQPERMQKALYVQQSHVNAFDLLALHQKQNNGLSAPELGELAILLLCTHFAEDTTKLQDTKRG